MIEQQVRCWDVLEARVLEIFREIPREQFVPDEYHDFAFADMDVPLSHGQHMLRPNVVGRLLQALELREVDRALEVGAGTGFVTACLAKQCASVRSLEILPGLAELAARTLSQLTVRNAEVVCVDAMSAGAIRERYDVIALTASMPIYDTRFEQSGRGSRPYRNRAESPQWVSCSLDPGWTPGAMLSRPTRHCRSGAADRGCHCPSDLQCTLEKGLP